MFTLPAFQATWSLVEEGADLAREREIESVFAIGNGYVGTRASLSDRTAFSFPATFLAGVFDRRTVDAVPELLLGPDWTRVHVRIGRRPLRLQEGDPRYRRILDLRRGLLWHEWRHRDPSGRETVIVRVQCVSLADRHLLLDSLTVTPQNYSARVHLDTWLAPLDQGAEPGRPAPHGLAPDPAGVSTSRLGSSLLLEYRTRDKQLTVACAAASHARLGAWESARRSHGFPTRLLEGWKVDVPSGETVRLDRRVVIYTSRDASDPVAAACEHLERALTRPMAWLREAHGAAWSQRWTMADVRIEGDAWAERSLRFAAYHLVSAATPEDPRVSVGARGLSGDAYKGHVFWDTEIFMLPFYTLAYPEAARALLLYRYHTLDAARKKARAYGYAGAMYAWESADTGEEVTPTWVTGPNGTRIRILTGEEEQHISADVAYAVWQYWQASGDDAFFCDAGAEILVETARFWASRLRGERDGAYHIRRVIGPDEYHESIDDNAYTNLMAQWNLEVAGAACDVLEARWPEAWARLQRGLGLSEDERLRWRDIARRVWTGFVPARRLYEQFAGYFDLAPIDRAQLEAHRTVPIDLVLGRDAVQRSQVVKQADVVMAVYLLWDRLSPAVRAANFRYYEPRTAHGSSLSPAIHAAVAARLGDTTLAMRYFRQAAEIDLANNMGNAAGGVHMAALGGLWQAAVMGFGGVQMDAEGLRVTPHLPEAWRTLSFRVHWRCRTATITVRQSPPELRVAVESGDAIPVSTGEAAPVSVAAGEAVVLPWSQREAA